MIQMGNKNNKIQTIGNKVFNGLKLGNKFSNQHDTKSVNHHSTPIENHSSNSQASVLHEPTGIHHSSKNKIKKSYLEKKY